MPAYSRVQRRSASEDSAVAPAPPIVFAWAFRANQGQGCRSLQGATRGQRIKISGNPTLQSAEAIVMPVSSDPVRDGLVASLARPGGNITGFSMMAPELGQKQLQLLEELFPKVSRAVAVLWNPAYVGMRARFEQTQVAAPAVGLRSVTIRRRSSCLPPAVLRK
jgi:hypothetical protein